MSPQTTNTLHGIVAAVDGSPSSDTAVAWAARDASLRNVPLTVVHVDSSDDAAVWLDVPLSAGYLAECQRIATEVVNRSVQLADTALTGRRAVPVRTLTPRGSVKPTLLDVSKDADMVVVGCRGKATLTGLLLGSTTSALIHHGHCPVAVVHEHGDEAASVSAPVVVGVDASPASDLAVAIAFDEAARRGVELRAVHTWLTRADFPDDVRREDLAAHAVEDLAQRLSGWCDRYPDVAVRRIVDHDSAAHRLLAEARDAQLLIVGSHGRGGFAGLLLGSVGWAVAQAAHIPVIVARRS